MSIVKSITDAGKVVGDESVAEKSAREIIVSVELARSRLLSGDVMAAASTVRHVLRLSERIVEEANRSLAYLSTLQDGGGVFPKIKR